MQAYSLSYKNLVYSGAIYPNDTFTILHPVRPINIFTIELGTHKIANLLNV